MAGTYLPAMIILFLNKFKTASEISFLSQRAKTHENHSYRKQFCTGLPRPENRYHRCTSNQYRNRPSSVEQIDDEASRIAAAYKIDEINKRPAIQATRKAYRSFGKDPNRYRVSSEALCRRIIRGLGIYRIDTLVDLINLVSVRSGYSIGAFDADRIEGDTLVLGVGKEGEIFRGIGRGILNIEGLPVYRDDKGGIGTPTSDEERTKITLDTKNLFVIINAYGEEIPLDETIAFTTELLRKYASAENIRTDIVSAGLFIE